MPMNKWIDVLHRGITPSQRRNRVIAEVAAQVAQGKPSFHSGSGTTIAAILHFLEVQGIEYTLTKHMEPGKGYTIQAMPKPDKALDNNPEVT